MSINQLILRNLKKNMKNYYLYVFALIFSVALYFAFVTLQYDPALDEAKGSVKGAAGVKAGSVLLVGIVSIFLLYANSIFVKRRSKEIGLLQLIGLTKGRIFTILSIENFIIYFGSIMVGIFLGFSSSKLIIMILFKVTKIDAIAGLHFSTQALVQTLVVFGVIYLCIMLMNYVFIKRQNIISLFRVTSSTEEKVKGLSIFEIAMGIAGLGLIVFGYVLSTRLFAGDFVTINQLFGIMIAILGSVIIGTYFFYKGSVSFIFNIIRKNKKGYLSINEVLSLSSIMFRMKSNALLLTIITTVSALAIGLLSLSYISYYSAEKMAKDTVAGDFSFTSLKDAVHFEEKLDAEGIAYNERKLNVLQADVNLKQIWKSKLEGMYSDPEAMTLAILSDKEAGISLDPDETVLTGYNDLLKVVAKLADSGDIELKGKSEVFPLHYLGLKDDFVVSSYFTYGGHPAMIVDETVFERLKKDLNPVLQKKSSLFIGLTLKDQDDLNKANHLFKQLKFNKSPDYRSRIIISDFQKSTMGLVMFIVGFLGLTFLITSGCILYFKQMGEGEEEKPNYTILRKLGFTRSDLLRGIQGKQVYNFGIPLLVGLVHSYFAVKSGWFLFGTEIWTPMLLVMVIYAGLYSIFGILSVMYYKKVIKEAL